MNKKQKEYKELRKLGYCKETVRRAIHGDISHTVRFIEPENDMLITEIFKMVRQFIEGYYNRGLPSEMLMSHLYLLEMQIKEDFVEVEKPIDKSSLGYAGDQNSPIPIYKEDNPLYRDSVGTEELK